MTPIQDIEIHTKIGRIFFVHFERSGQEYRCQVAELDRKTQRRTAYSPFAKEAPNAVDAFSNLVAATRTALATESPGDDIVRVDNPNGDELISVTEQKRILGQNVTTSLHGNEF